MVGADHGMAWQVGKSLAERARAGPSPAWAGWVEAAPWAAWRQKVGNGPGSTGEEPGPPPAGKRTVRSSKGTAWIPLPQLPLWPGWQGLGAPSSLELAGIKGRKAVLRPRPLRQESVAPGDGIRSHIPGALVATRQGWGRAECRDWHHGAWERCLCQLPGRRAPSARPWLWPSPFLPSLEGLRRTQEGSTLPGGGDSYGGLGPSAPHFPRGDAALMATRHPGLADPALSQLARGRASRGGVGCPWQVSYVAAGSWHTRVHARVCTQPGAVPWQESRSACPGCRSAAPREGQAPTGRSRAASALQTPPPWEPSQPPRSAQELAPSTSHPHPSSQVGNRPREVR